MEDHSLAAKIRSTPMILRWMPGPSAQHAQPVVVSVTEFRANNRRDLPGVATKGAQMRLGWYAMSGAVGMWLWSLPAGLRGGSISVWEDQASLDRFISLPHHVNIMNRYRPRGTVRSDQWSMERFEPDAILTRARDWINEPTTCAG
jgi:hypothetical protein